jgi:hypothetical protein
MSEIVIIYAITMVSVCILASLLVFYRYFLGNKLNAQADKLKSQMANIRRDFPELGRNPKEFVGSTIGDIGIQGIMEEMGIDPSLLSNPLVKGLISKYAPRILEQISKKQEQGKQTELGIL